MQKLRHLKRRTLLAGGAALALVLVTFMAFIAPRTAVAEATNLAANKSAVSSSDKDNTTAGAVTDGVVEDQEGYWSSGDLKSETHGDTSGDNQEQQTPQWVYIDLGEGTYDLESIEIVWRANKVWGMEYEIQTASETPDSDGNTNWQTIASVSRASAPGNLTQGDGQDIANTETLTDTITADSKPALESTTAQRYVRLYITKTNWQAPGHNINLCEIRVNGTARADEPAVEPWNVALSRPVTVSGSSDGTAPENLVDGSTSTQWNSPNLKDGIHTNTDGDDDAQTPQWAYVDLGASETTLDRIQITYMRGV